MNTGDEPVQRLDIADHRSSAKCTKEVKLLCIVRPTICELLQPTCTALYHQEHPSEQLQTTITITIQFNLN